MKKIAIFMPIKINSERVKNKSIKNLFGRPLLNWSLESLDSLGHDIFIYTSSVEAVRDSIDFEYKNIKILPRSEELDQNSTLGIEIYESFAGQVDAESYLLVHCTSPFVHAETYREIIKIGLSGEYDSASSCHEIKSFCFYDGNKVNFEQRVKTQDLKPVVVENSAFYFFTKETLLSKSRSGERHMLYNLKKIESIDLDYDEDFEFLERINSIKRGVIE